MTSSHLTYRECLLLGSSINQPARKARLPKAELGMIVLLCEPLFIGDWVETADRISLESAGWTLALVPVVKGQVCTSLNLQTYRLSTQCQGELQMVC